jgi:hypothetical protein
MDEVQLIFELEPGTIPLLLQPKARPEDVVQAG